MEMHDIIATRRTIRKFRQEPLNRDRLETWVSLARLAPSGANRQPLRYYIANDPSMTREISRFVRWAAMIAPEGNPEPHELPAAYIWMLADSEVSKSGFEPELGAAAENIMLAAWSEGVGSCWLGNIDRKDLLALAGVPEKYLLHSVIALGYPAETPETEEGSLQSLKYYKDAKGVLHVPKLVPDDVILK